MNRTYRLPIRGYNTNFAIIHRRRPTDPLDGCLCGIVTVAHTNSTRQVSTVEASLFKGIAAAVAAVARGGRKDTTQQCQHDDSSSRPHGVSGKLAMAGVYMTSKKVLYSSMASFSLCLFKSIFLSLPCNTTEWAVGEGRNEKALFKLCHDMAVNGVSEKSAWQKCVQVR